MQPFPVLVGNVLLGLVLLVFAFSLRLRPRSRAGLLTLALVPALDAVLLVVYVFSEDTYRDNGISRWDAYRSPGGALGPMFVTSIVVLVGCAAVLGFASVAGRRPLVRPSLWVASLASLFFVSATIAGFSSN